MKWLSKQEKFYRFTFIMLFEFAAHPLLKPSSRLWFYELSSFEQLCNQNIIVKRSIVF